MSDSPGSHAAQAAAASSHAAPSGSPSGHAAQAAGANSHAALEAAKSYLAAVIGRPGTAADWKKAVAAGALLLDCVGGVISAATESLWQARAPKTA